MIWRSERSQMKKRDSKVYYCYSRGERWSVGLESFVFAKSAGRRCLMGSNDQTTCMLTCM